MYSNNEPFRTNRGDMMTIFVVSMLIAGCLSTATFLTQIDFIVSGVYWSITRKYIALAAVMLSITVTVILVTWYLIFTRLINHLLVPVSFLFICVTVVTGVMMASGIDAAIQELRTRDRELRFNPSPLDR
jgi:hypothetical protein